MILIVSTHRRVQGCGTAVHSERTYLLEHLVLITLGRHYETIRLTGNGQNTQMITSIDEREVDEFKGYLFG